MATIPGLHSKRSLEVQESDITAEKPRMARAHWLSLRGDRALPQPADFDASALGQLLAWLQWVEVTDRGSDFRYLTVGEIPRILHRARTQGRKISEIREWSSAWKESVTEFYQFVYEARRPVWTAGNLSHFDEPWQRFESVNLPWSADGKHVDHILTVTEYFPVGDDGEMLRTTYRRRSPS